MALLITFMLLIAVIHNGTNSETTERLSTEETKRLIASLFSNEDGPFCPGADICRTERSKLLEKRKNFDGVDCCTDCSCDDDCVFYNDCCFPPNGSLHFDPDEECVRAVSIPISFKQLPSQPMFYMVISCNRSSVDNLNVTDCWKFKESAPWGPIFPVYSKLTHKLYINQQCAWCNNVFDGVLLNPSFSCLELHHSEIVTLTNALEDLRSDDNNCFVYFSEKNDLNSYLISKKRCLISRQIMDTCYRQVLHQPVANLSYQTVFDLCQSNFYSRAFNDLGVFKNVFCMMCLRYYEPNRQQHGQRDPAHDLGFTVMIDGSLFKSYKTFEDYETPQDKACRVLPNKTLDTDNCRHIHCPNGQYRNTNGACVFPTGRWSTNGLVLFLNFTPTENIAITKEVHFEIYLPLKRQWRLQRVFYTTRADKSEAHMVDSIVLELAYCPLNARLYIDEEDFNDLLQDIDRSLHMQWNIFIFQTKSLYRIQFMPYISTRLFEYSLGKWVFGINKPSFEGCFKDFNAKNTTIFNAVMETGLLLDETFVYISKHFFCHRIKFSGEEIKLSDDALHLYISDFDILLDELSLVTCQTPTSRDALCAKVCIDDVPFELFTNGLVKNYIVTKAFTYTYILFFSLSTR